MMFGMWRRGRNRGRGLMTMGMGSLVLALIGLALLFGISFFPATEGISIPQPEPLGLAPVAPPMPVITPVTSDVGLIVAAVVICAIVLLAAGMRLGISLQKSSSAENVKAKNEDVVEKKKKRLTTPQYAHTSDGESLEVVDDDGKSLTI